MPQPVLIPIALFVQVQRVVIVARHVIQIILFQVVPAIQPHAQIHIALNAPPPPVLIVVLFVILAIL